MDRKVHHLSECFSEVFDYVRTGEVKNMSYYLTLI